MSGKRIAIVGGDDRVERFRWPSHYDIRFYKGEKWGGNGSLRGLVAGLAAGRFDAVIILTRWIGHAPSDTLRGATTCRLVKWPRGAGELAKHLDDLLDTERKAA